MGCMQIKNRRVVLFGDSFWSLDRSLSRDLPFGNRGCFLDRYKLRLAPWGVIRRSLCSRDDRSPGEQHIKYIHTEVLYTS